MQEGVSLSIDFIGFQSRFSKWFFNSSRDNSRRLFINEDFGYLNGEFRINIYFDGRYLKFVYVVLVV